MKKIVLAAAVAAISTTAMAQSYVQGNVGYAQQKITLSSVDASLSDSTPTVRLAYGQDNGAFRYAFDYTYFGKIDKKSEVQLANGTQKSSLDLSAHSLGASAFYDFNVASMPELTPYVGGRLGLNYLTADIKDGFYNAQGTRTAYNDSKSSETRIGVGAVVGAQYRLTQNLSLDAGVEYNLLGSWDNLKLHQCGATVGVRYDF